MLDFPLSPKQLTSLREANTRVTIYEGSIRSGKTIVSLLRFLIFVATAPYGGQLVVIARTRDTAARNVFAPLMDPLLFGAMANQVSYTAGAPTGKILGRTIYVIGASDAKAEKVLRGLTVAGAYVDEITVIPEEFFTQLLGRMSVIGAQLFGTTNPDSPAHWLKRKFLDRIKQLPDWRSFHFVLSDNPSLTSEYIESISREFTGLWHRRFIRGEWVAAEGAIYSMWDEKKHTVPWSDLPQMKQLIGVGLDYGTTNATAGLLLGLSRELQNGLPASRLYLIDEFRYDSRLTGTRLTDAELSQRFGAWLTEDHLPYKTTLEPEFVFLDPSAASFRQQLYSDGIDTSKAVNDVSYGIGVTASLLSQEHLAISDRCPGFITEAPGYSWNTKKSDEGLDVPVKVADHSLDGSRYAIVSAEMQWRDEIRWRSSVELAA